MAQLLLRWQCWLQMRDKGSMEDILFEDITVSAQHCKPQANSALPHLPLLPMPFAVQQCLSSKATLSATSALPISSPARSTLPLPICQLTCLAMAAPREIKQSQQPPQIPLSPELCQPKCLVTPSHTSMACCLREP